MGENELTIQIRRLPENGDVPLPGYQTEGAAALDLHAAVKTPVPIAPGETAIIPCGFAMAVPAGYEAQVRPRSGLAAKDGVTVLNAPGTVDADYRDEVKVILINHGKTVFTVERGARIAQMVVAPVPRVAWMEVQQLPETSRGEGGFGHTGQ